MDATPRRSERQVLRDALSVAREALAAGDAEAWSAALRLSARLGEHSRRAEDGELRACLERLESGPRLLALDALLRSIGQPALTRPRVLVVDDDPDVCDLVAAALGEPWLVERAGDLDAAAQRLESASYDVVLLDLTLPDGDGRQLLVGAPQAEETTFVVFSGRDDRVSYSECLALGAEAFLRKPVDPGALTVTLRRAMARRLRLRAAQRDALTGLATRDALSASFSRRVSVARADAPVCLALIDMDDFKGINDRHGHLAGDRALEGLGRALRTCLRGADAAFRWGGDEFVLLLPGTDGAGARRVLDRVRRELAAQRRARPGAESIPLAFSAGLVELHGPVDLQRALALADRALYRSKRLRRGAAQTASEQAPATLNLTASTASPTLPARDAEGCGVAPTLHGSLP